MLVSSWSSWFSFDILIWDVVGGAGGLDFNSFGSDSSEDVDFKWNSILDEVNSSVSNGNDFSFGNQGGVFSLEESVGWSSFISNNGSNDWDIGLGLWFLDWHHFNVDVVSASGVLQVLNLNKVWLGELSSHLLNITLNQIYID